MRDNPEGLAVAAEMPQTPPEFAMNRFQFHMGVAPVQPQSRRAAAQRRAQRERGSKSAVASVAAGRPFAFFPTSQQAEQPVQDDIDDACFALWQSQHPFCGDIDEDDAEILEHLSLEGETALRR